MKRFIAKQIVLVIENRDTDFMNWQARLLAAGKSVVHAECYNDLIDQLRSGLFASGVVLDARLPKRRSGEDTVDVGIQCAEVLHNACNEIGRNSVVCSAYDEDIRIYDEVLTRLPDAEFYPKGVLAAACVHLLGRLRTCPVVACISECDDRCSELCREFAEHGVSVDLYETEEDMQIARMESYPLIMLNRFVPHSSHSAPDSAVSARILCALREDSITAGVNILHIGRSETGNASFARYDTIIGRNGIRAEVMRLTGGLFSA